MKKTDINDVIKLYLFGYIGADVLPWLGDLRHLAPVGDFADPPYGDEDNKTPFPVRPVDRRSYAQNCVVWIKPSGLQV